MFILYSIILSLFLKFGHLKIKKESQTIIYLIVVMLSPILYFIEPKINYGVFNSVLSSGHFSQLFLIIYLVITGVYWISKLVKEKKEELPILQNEGFALILILSGLVNIKILLLILFSSLIGFRFEDDIKVSVKHSLLVLLLMLIYIGPVVPVSLILILFIVLIVKFFTEKISENDHYVLFILISLLNNYEKLDDRMTLIAMFMIMVSFWRFKLSSEDRTKLKVFILKNKLIQLMYDKTQKESLNTIKLNYLSYDEEIARVNKSRPTLKLHKNEHSINLITIVSCILLIMVIIMEATWY